VIYSDMLNNIKTTISTVMKLIIIIYLMEISFLKFLVFGQYCK